MIDWVSCSIPYPGIVVQDAYLVHKFGSNEVESHFNKGIHVKGSFDSGMSVHCTGSMMYLSGNPVKFLTGQNVVGINCMKTLIVETYNEVLRILGIPDSIEARTAFKTGNVKITRADCTFAYHVGSDDDVAAWIESMEQCCTVAYRGRGHFNATMCSVYFGLGLSEDGAKKASRRSTFKFYNKLRELSAHPPTCPPEFRDRLIAMATGIVRGEATFRSPELKRLGFQYLAAWNLSTPYDLHKLWIEKMDITPSVRLQDETEMDLPRAVRSSYLHWKNGECMKTLLPHNTFYRHRRALLEHDIDIALPRRDRHGQDHTTVVPVINVLEADPVDETDGEELFWDIFETRRRA